jgi:CRISPR-associated exonuclease Cas4
MTGKHIEAGAIFYGKQRRRKNVPFTEDLRNQTIKSISRLHEFIRQGKTPAPEYDKAKCPRCSLNAVCLPKKMERKQSVSAYFSRMLKEAEGS